MTVLSTKTIDQKTVDYAASLNLDVRCVDFIKVSGVKVDVSSIDRHLFDSVAFTSSNAVKHFFQNENAPILLNGKNIFSLSGKTSEELSKRNFKVTCIGETAEELANSIIQSKLSKSVLHVCGNLTLKGLGEKLQKMKIEYTPVLVYKTVLQKNIILKEDFDAIMFYSPSGVKSFFINNKLKNETVCCCIGHTTAEVVREKKHNARIILPRLSSTLLMIEAIAWNFQKTESN